MYITREADYAVRCILLLSKETDRIISAKEISKSMSIPRSFLAKILQRLSRKGIVKSTQGVSGGFQLGKKPREINLLEVIEAIQGPSAMSVCAIDKRVCSLSGTCAVHPIWVELREDVEKRLKRENFAKLVRKR
jgi:Rrf2 family protein